MNKQLKKELNLNPHFNVSDSIPIVSISDEGIIETRKGMYSKTYALSDINFQIARRIEKGEMYDAYCGFLNGLDPSQNIQLTIYNHRVSGDSTENDVLLTEVGDGLDDLRADYNKIIIKNIELGQNNIKKDKYVTLSFEANDMVAADKSFSAAENELLSHISDIPGADVKPLSLTERLNLIRSMYNPGADSDFSEYAFINGKKVKSFSIENMYAMGMNAKELVQPSSMEFRDRYFKLGDKWCAALNIIVLPKVIKDSFLNDMTNVDFDMILTLNIEEIEKADAFKMVDKKLTNIEAEWSESASSSGIPSHRIRGEQEEIDDLMTDISKRDQNLFNAKLHFVIFGDTEEELKEHVEKIKSMGRSRGVTLSVAKSMQEQCLTSTLPFGTDNTGIYRTLTTESVGGFVPFSAQELQAKKTKNSIPIYYGINKITKSIITYDTFSGDSYGSAVLGFTGSGKSMSVKNRILNTLLCDSDSDIIIIDPNNEYGDLVNALHGQVIDVIGSGKQRINPFDIDKNYGEEGQDPTAAKIDFIMSMIQVMIGQSLNLTAIQKNAIIMAGKEVYNNWLSNDKNDNYIPTLEDFYEIIAGREDVNQVVDIYELSETISRFTKRGVDVIFSDKSNVDINNRLVSFGIQNLGDDLKPLAMLVILDSIWCRICKNKKLKRQTYIYIDEFHLLLKSKMVAAYILKLVKTIRKYNAGICLITQNIEDLITSEEGRGILNNTPFVTLLKQSELDRRALADLYNLSPTQLSYITNTKPGEGLLYVQASQNLANTSIIPFKNIIPEDSKIYNLLSTKVTKDED